MKNVWCMNFFEKPACLQEFFSRAYELLLLGITACGIFFFKQVPLPGIFFGGIVTTPPVISNGPSLTTKNRGQRSCGYQRWISIKEDKRDLIS